MGTRERRLRERQLRAEQIELAARKVFTEHGYEDATIQGIAREAELSVGAIYFYFKTKEEIFASINLKIIEQADEGLAKIVARRDASPVQKVTMAWDLLYQVFCQTSLTLRALVHGQLQGSLQNISAPLLEKLNATGKSLMGKYAAMYREGMEKGVFIETNPTAFADVFWGTFTGVVSWEEAKRKTNPDKQFLKPTMDLALETLIRGLKA